MKSPAYNSSVDNPLLIRLTTVRIRNDSCTWIGIYTIYIDGLIVGHTAYGIPA